MISAAVIEALKEIVPADKVLLQEPMKLHTTFRIGGPADCLVYLENEEQLCKIQKYLRSLYRDRQRKQSAGQRPGICRNCSGGW